MQQEMTVSSTGFVNYFPSDERTARQIAGAYAKYGDDIIIIDGDDDWFANAIYHVSSLLQKAGLQKIADFHIGISGISKSGAVIKKSDLPAFIRFIQDNYISIMVNSDTNDGTSRLAYYDKENTKWVTLLETSYANKNDFSKRIFTAPVLNF